MISAQSQKRFTLIEMMVYMGLFAIIIVMLGPLLAGGLYLSEATGRLMDCTKSTNSAFEYLKRGLRRGSDIKCTSGETSHNDIPLLIRGNDGREKGFMIRNKSLVQVNIPEDAALHTQEDIPKAWMKPVVAGRFTGLKVAHIPGTHRVYRITLTAEVKRTGRHNGRF